jgi:wyosine [tRNA(Phe)-imidazoG37] synthetase (radical SAM superfamily)
VLTRNLEMTLTGYQGGQISKVMGYNTLKVFGPVPSRRLGRSLGVNNIPPKICTYACVYCQLGRTIRIQLERKEFYQIDDVVLAVRDKVESLKKRGENIDYLSFVPDGEPTLDINLGKEIDLIKALGIKIAVISNASLIGNKAVRDDLIKADWVSLKVDAVTEKCWRKIDRSHGSLKLRDILDGIKLFSNTFKGNLVTETMLVKGINDSQNEISETASFLAELNLDKAYIAIPTRPPTEKWAKPPCERNINTAYQIFSETLDEVEYLIGYEGNAFASTGDAEDDLLSITAVHPMREEAVCEFISKTNAGYELIDKLLHEGKLIETEYQGRKFYTRRLSEQNN